MLKSLKILGNFSNVIDVQPWGWLLSFVIRKSLKEYILFTPIHVQSSHNHTGSIRTEISRFIRNTRKRIFPVQFKLFNPKIRVTEPE